MSFNYSLSNGFACHNLLIGEHVSTVSCSSEVGTAVGVVVLLVGLSVIVITFIIILWWWRYEGL